MKPTTKIQIAAFVAALALLAIAWVVTDYKQTWLYVALIPIIIPNAWWVALFNKNRD